MRSQVGKRLDEAEIHHATRSERGKRRQHSGAPRGRIPKPKRP
jgi:hypothetical protein